MISALGVRWIIIDEFSTIPLELLSQLNAALRRACLRHPYAKDGTRRRPLGGINIVFAGDLWQPHPVRANAVFSHPYTKGVYNYGEKHILEMFWQHREDSVQDSFELTENKRTTDPWLRRGRFIVSNMACQQEILAAISRAKTQLPAVAVIFSKGRGAIRHPSQIRCDGRSECRQSARHANKSEHDAA